MACVPRGMCYCLVHSGKDVASAIGPGHFASLFFVLGRRRRLLGILSKSAREGTVGASR